ncbi:MAG: hypothetical protein ABIX01_12945 [Chitinophagaceae bacterium]
MAKIIHFHFLLWTGGNTEEAGVHLFTVTFPVMVSEVDLIEQTGWD